MNINTLDFVEDSIGSSLDSEIREHHEVLVTAGIELTGEYILIPEGLDYPCSMQVWSKTPEGQWVYIDSAGELHERENPLVGEPV